MDLIEIQPVAGELQQVSIQPPGSKSLTNRALTIAAMSAGTSVLSGFLASDDTTAMMDSLSKLGVALQVERPESAAARLIIDGCSGDFDSPNEDLFIGNSGTTVRFLTAMLGLAGGNFRLDGVPRMRERPIGPLVDALVTLGIDAVAESPGGCPPVSIRSHRAVGGTLTIQGDLSSQYLSGLMMAAPLARNGLTIKIQGPLISKPYVEMTRRVMAAFGVQCDASECFDEFTIAGGQRYQATEYLIEPDASAASYFWAAAAICGGSGTVVGLSRDSLQGDVGFVDCLEQMGCEVQWQTDSITVSGPARHGIDIDMSDVSDTVQTLAAVALFVEGPTTVRNVAHNRVKETDRIGNLAIELRKFGAQVTEHVDGLTIEPIPKTMFEGKSTKTIEPIETYDDHRMAMSLALVGLKLPGVKILDPACVSKTFPDYFAALEGFVRR